MKWGGWVKVGVLLMFAGFMFGNVFGAVVAFAGAVLFGESEMKQLCT